MVLIETMIICSLMLGSGADYDCDQKWIIFIYDEVDMKDHCPTPESGHVVGCSRYMLDPNYDWNGMPIIWIGSSDFIDEWGMTVLHHEIAHIQCRCNFHE